MNSKIYSPDEKIQQQLGRLFCVTSTIVAFSYTCLYYYFGNLRAFYSIGFATFVVFVGSFLSYRISHQKIRILLTLTWTLGAGSLPFTLGGFESMGSVWVVSIPVVSLLLVDNRSSVLTFMLSLGILVTAKVLDYQGINLNGFPFSPGSTDFKNLNFLFGTGLVITMFIFVQVFSFKEKQLGRELIAKNQEISENNQKMANILNSIHQGILIIDDMQKIQDGYSKHTCDILGQSDLYNKEIFTILGESAVVSQDQLSLWNTVLLNVIGTNELNFKLNSHIFPTVLKLRDGRTLDMQWMPLKDDKNQVISIMVAIRDISMKIKVETQEKIQNRNSEIIGQLAGCDFHSCQHFLESSARSLSRCLKELKNEDADESMIFRELHTIKGNSRVLSFTYLADSLHIAEEALSVYRANRSPALHGVVVEKTEASATILTEYDKIYKSTFQKFDSDSHYSEVVKLIRDFSRSDSQESDDREFRISGAKFLNDYQNLMAKPLSIILERQIKASKLLSQKLMKRSPEFCIDGEDRILESCHNNLQVVFLHLIRNSLDHGFQENEEENKINIKVSHTEQDRLKITYEDSGKGMNLVAIHKKYGNDLKTQFLSDRKIEELVFQSGFSSKTECTEVSGRGVGMDAVRNSLKQIGADIDIHWLEEHLPGQEFRRFQFRILFEKVHAVIYNAGRTS